MPLLGGPAVVPFEAVPLPMVMAAADGQALAVNAGWRRLTGLSEDESLGSGWLTVLAPVYRTAMRSIVIGTASSGRNLTTDLLWRDHPDRWARWWLTAHERAGQVVVGVAVADIAAQPEGQGGESLRTSDIYLEAIGRRDDLIGEIPAVLDRVESMLDTLESMRQAGLL